MHVGQSKVAAGVVEGKSTVVQTHQVQNRGMEVMNVNGPVFDTVADVVGLAVDDAWAHAAAGHAIHT